MFMDAKINLSPPGLLVRQFGRQDDVLPILEHQRWEDIPTNVHIPTSLPQELMQIR